MFNQERGIFKPSLKTHSINSNPTSKRFSFVPSTLDEDVTEGKLATFREEGQQQLWPNSCENQYGNGWNAEYAKLSQTNGQKKYQLQSIKPYQSVNSLTVTKFDPILPKLIFKRFVEDTQTNKDLTRPHSNQIIQQLKVKSINYPLEVERLFRETEDNKTLFQKCQLLPQNAEKVQEGKMVDQVVRDQVVRDQSSWAQNSYRQSLKGKFSKGLRKIPYFPLMGTDGAVFWTHSFDKLILWRYKGEDIYCPEVFCMLSFKHQLAPISAVYATEIQSSIFKKQRTVLISVALFNQLHFFTFDITKYQKQYLVQMNSNEKTEKDFEKYVQKILIKVNANFLVEKIIIRNIPNYSSSTRHLRPLVIFTDGGKDIQIVDLQNASAFKSHTRYNPFSIKKRKQQDKNQNQIIKLLHCTDQNNPLIHYAFVLRKQTSLSELKPKNIYQKIKQAISFGKKVESEQEIMLSIYQYNETQLKNNTLWQQLFNPPRLKKIKQVTSRDLQNKVKQNFFQFAKLNSNNNFTIADVSLVQKQQKYKIFSKPGPQGYYLKVSFSNGTSILISNFRTLSFLSRVKVNPYIQKNIPITACQYQNYHKLLDKGKYLQKSTQMKNKFNYYIYQPTQFQKQPKYCLIDPVISECNGLNICQNKIMYEDESQISYYFSESTSRKRIHQLNLKKSNYKKNFMIFQNSYITLVSTPNIAQNLLLLGYLNTKYNQSKAKIHKYINSMFYDVGSQSNKIDFIQNIIQLLLQIQSSGKAVHSKTLENKVMFNQLVKQLYDDRQSKRIITDQTMYFDQRDSGDNKLLEQTYRYSFVLDKVQYQNFVEYLLGGDILLKQKEYLRSVNSAYSTDCFEIMINDDVFSFLLQVLIEHGMRGAYSSQIKSARNVVQFNTSLSKYISESVKNTYDKKYLTHLFSNMTQINESFLTCSLSKFVVCLLCPILDVSYKQYNQIKPTYVRIIEKLWDLQKILIKFIHYSSFKNNSNNLFEQTIMLCKSIQNSLPKIILLMRLFDALSQTQFINPRLQSSDKVFRDEITLKNIFFRVDAKQTLSQITVQQLFQDNSILLDQIQAKLPQLNEVKYLRYFIGWRKINSKLIQSYRAQKPNNRKSQQRVCLFNWFSFQKQGLKKPMNYSLLVQDQQLSQQEFVKRQQKQFFQVQTALSQYSFQDFAKYFVTVNRFYDFVQIILSKIYYLQTNYVQFRSKYHFDQEGYFNFTEYPSLEQKIIEESRYDDGYGYMNKRRDNIAQTKGQKNPKFNQFLRYEQKVYNHQKYLKTYQLIRFFNQKMLEFIRRILEIYLGESNKLSKQLLPKMTQIQSKWKLNNQPFFGEHSLSNQSYFQILVKQVQKVLDLIFSKGSQYVKSQVLKTLKDSEVYKTFLMQGKVRDFLNNSETHQHQHQSQYSGQRYDISKNANYMVGNINMPTSQKDKADVLFEMDTKRMYQQKIDQKHPGELKSNSQLRNLNDWMKTYVNKSPKMYFYNKNR